MSIEEERDINPRNEDEVQDASPDASDIGGDSARRRAIRQLKLKRKFQYEAVSSAIGIAVVVIIWSISEYRNALGWPTHGFSQSSGMRNVWNFWIIYPVLGWVLIMSARAWSVFGRKPISKDQTRREIERQSGGR